MSDYKFKRIVAKKDRISTIVETVYVPDEVVKQIRADAIDEFVNACKENIMCQTFGLHQKAVENIAEQLKEQDNEQIHI